MNSIFKKIAPPCKKYHFFDVLPWVWLVSAYCITMGFLALHGRAYIDSDMAGEMVLADLLNKEGGILSTNWGYSTEIRVFYLQVIYRLTLMIFPNNWFAAHMLGQAVWMLLLILSYLYVGRGLGLKNSGVWGAAALACPFGLWYLWYGAFGGQYTVYMVMLLFNFGLTIRLVQPSSIYRQIFRAALLAISCFIFSLGTIKVIMALYLPMVVAAVFCILLQLHTEPSKAPKNGFKYLGVSVYTLFFAGIGFLINSRILSKTHDFLSHNDRIWGTFDISKLLKYWCDFLSLLGFQNLGISFVQTESPLFTLYGVLGALALVLAAAVIISLICLFVRWASLSEHYQLAFLVFISVCLVQGSIFAFTDGSDAPNASYWLTPMPLLFIILQMAWETAPFQFHLSRKICAVFFMFCVIGVSISTVHTYFTEPPRAVPKLEPVADWLVENGYSDGYASLWNCNVLIEWSNGRLDMRSVNEYTLDVTESHTWLERLDHSVPPAGKVFLLTSAQELWGAHKESLRNDYNVYWDENDYLIMAFDSYNEMVSAIENAHSD